MPQRYTTVRKAFPYMLSGVALTLFMAWGLPLLLASRGLGPVVAPALVWASVSPTDGAPLPPANTENWKPAIMEVRRSAFSDWYVAYPSTARDDGEITWPTLGLKTLVDAGNTNRKLRHAPGAVVAEAPSAQSRNWARIDTGLAGWPFRAFASEAWYRATTVGALEYEPIPEFRWTIHIGEIGGQQALVPLRPLLIGIAFDIAFWSTASWFALALPTAIRHRRREKYGRCALCGYAMGKHEVKRPTQCPECGATFTPDPLRFVHCPEMHFQNAYVWLIFVSSLDIMLTWKILDRGGVEVNPLASLVIDGWGMQGAIAFKFALMMWVIVVCELLARMRRGAGRFLAYAAVIVSASPVLWSLFLITAHEFFPKVLE